MLPLTLGFLLAAPASGYLSDRFGARWFSTGGMVLTAVSFVLLEALPIDFDYWAFAACCWSPASAWACSPRRTGRRS